MSLWKNAVGTYEGTVRRKGMRPLHLSMRTKKLGVARDRFAALRYVARAGSPEFVQLVRIGAVTIERLTELVSRNEPLTIGTPDAIPVLTWASVDASVATFLEWMEANPKKRAGTRRLAGFQLAPFAAFEFEGQRLGDLPLDRVTGDMFQAYQKSFLAAERSVNSVTTYMSRVAHLYRGAQKQEIRKAREGGRLARTLHTPVDPEATVRDTRTRDRCLSQDEMTRLFAATPAPLLSHVACGLYAGLRLGEVLHLRPTLDIDMELGTLSVRVQNEWKPKTPRSKRTVPIAGPLKAILAHHLIRYSSEMWLHPSPTDDTFALDVSTFRKQFMACVVRAGLPYGRDKPQGVTFHTLRHSFASHAVMQGVDLYTVSQLLGDSLTMVETTYAHLSPDFKKAAIAKIAAAIKQPEADENAQLAAQETDE